MTTLEKLKLMKTILIIVGILAALFVLLSGFLIVYRQAWTHKPISIRQMLKEYIEELRRK